MTETVPRTQTTPRPDDVGSAAS